MRRDTFMGLTVAAGLLLLPVMFLWAAAEPAVGRGPTAPETAPFVYRSPSGVVFTVTGQGLSRIALGDRVLAEGGWATWNAGPAWFKRGGPEVLGYGGYSADVYAQVATNVRDKAVTPLGADRVQVRHVQPDVVVTYDYAFTGEDVTIRARVENNHPSAELAVPAFGGLRFAFGRVPDGIMNVWHPSYLQAIGNGAFHPAHNNKIGGSYAVGDGFGVGVSPRYTGLKRTLIFWDYARWNPDDAARANRWLTCLSADAVPAGGALTFTFTLRVSPNREWTHLLQPYKEQFLANFGPRQYTTDFRCVAVAHVNRNAEAIGPGNPYGFHGGFRRLDLTNGVAEFCDTLIPGLREANGQGVIIWGQGGQEPRGEMYRSDFDVLPPEVETNWPTLSARFREAGLELGVTTRPRDLHARADWRRDLTIDINPDDSAHMTMLWNRFHHMIEKGCTLYYLDSFGSSFEDVKTMRFLRGKMGPKIKTYTEHACDVMAVYSAFYSETDFYAKGSADWATEDGYHLRTGLQFMRIVNWMLGRVPVITRVYDVHGKIPEGFETATDFFYRNGLSPMISDYKLGELAPTIRAVQDAYLDAAGQPIPGKSRQP